MDQNVYNVALQIKKKIGTDDKSTRKQIGVASVGNYSTIKNVFKVTYNKINFCVF